jgi:hypothetical protein
MLKRGSFRFTLVVVFVSFDYEFLPTISSARISQLLHSPSRQCHAVLYQPIHSPPTGHLLLYTFPNALSPLLGPPTSSHLILMALRPHHLSLDINSPHCQGAPATTDSPTVESPYEGLISRGTFSMAGLSTGFVWGELFLIGDDWNEGVLFFFDERIGRRVAGLWAWTSGRLWMRWCVAWERTVWVGRARWKRGGMKGGVCGTKFLVDAEGLLEEKRSLVKLEDALHSYGWKEGNFEHSM